MLLAFYYQTDIEMGKNDRKINNYSYKRNTLYSFNKKADLKNELEA